MPRQIVDRGELLSASPFSNCALVVLFEILESPVANLSCYFLNYVVLSLGHIYYYTMFGVLAAE